MAKEVDILGADDRGLQKRAGNPGGIPLSSAQLYEARIHEVHRRTADRFVKGIESSIRLDEEAKNLLPITAELVSPVSLHSVRFLADEDLLVSLATSASKAEELTRIVSDRSTSFTSVASRMLAESVVHSQMDLFQQGESPSIIRRRTQIAFRASRNLAYFDNNLVRRLLAVTQITAAVNFKGFGEICTGSSEVIEEVAKQELKARGMEGDFLMRELIEPTKGYLEGIEPFVATAELGRAGNDEETYEQVTRRGLMLTQVMATVAEEYESEHPKEELSQGMARILIEAFFAHRIQWGNNKETVKVLCQTLYNKGCKKTAAEVLLQAQNARLINLQENPERYYEECGVDVRLLSSHQKRLFEQRVLGAFNMNPYNAVRGHSRVLMSLGYQNVPQLGHRGLAVGGLWTYNDPWKAPEIPLVISLNKEKSGTTVIAGLDNSTKVPYYPFEERVPLVQTNLAGLVDGGIKLTSIDLVTEGKDPPPERTKSFLENAGRVEDVRLCGIDREDLTPTDIVGGIFATRGYDLLLLVKDPGRLTELQQKFPNADIHILLIQGASDISATVTANLGLAALKGSERAMNRFRSFVHPDNVEPTLNMIQDAMPADSIGSKDQLVSPASNRGQSFFADP